MVYKKPKTKKVDKLITVFDKKTNKNVIMSQDKLRKIINDPKFTDQDRYEVAKKKAKGGLVKKK